MNNHRERAFYHKQVESIPEKESDFTTWVEDLLKRFGYTVAHFRPAKTDKGWRTAVSCDGAGFPDYLVIKDERQLAIELKSESGQLSPEQINWLNLFSGVSECYVWRPTDKAEIEQIILLGHNPNLIEREMFHTAWKRE